MLEYIFVSCCLFLLCLSLFLLITFVVFLAYRNEQKDSLKREPELEGIRQEVEKVLTVRALPLLLLVRFSNDSVSNVKRCYRALELCPRERNERLWAKLKIILALNLASLEEDEAESLGRDEAELLDESEVHASEALEFLTRNKDPEMWAFAHFALTLIHVQRVDKEFESFDKMLFHAQQAREVYSSTDYPEMDAKLQQALAFGFALRVDETTEDLHGLRYAAGQAQNYMETNDPEEWARLHLALALSYLDEAEDIEDSAWKGIYHAQQALEVYTPDEFPDYWANMHFMLATFYLSMIDEKSIDVNHINRTMFHASQVPKVSSEIGASEGFSALQEEIKRVEAARRTKDFVKTAIKKGVGVQAARHFEEHEEKVYELAGELNEMEGGPSNAAQRIILSRELLTLLKHQQPQPSLWAAAHVHLGNGLANSPEIDQTLNLEQAIHHYRQALLVYSSTEHPKEWARVHYNIGNTFVARIRGGRSENQEKAIQHFDKALKVQKRLSFHEDLARTLHSLAGVYLDRILGDSAHNIEKAIDSYKSSLELSTDNVQHAKAHNGLGNAFRKRLVGDRSDNLELSIFHYQEALEVFTIETFPDDWATTTASLASAFQSHVDGEQESNVEKAIHLYQQALQVQTADRNPRKHQRIQGRLGDLYFSKGQWRNAYTAYKGAIDVGQIVTTSSHTEAGRRASIGETQTYFSRAAFSLLKIGQVSEALLTLDQGKFRLFSEALTVTNIRLQSLPSEIHESIVRRWRQILEHEAQVGNTPGTSQETSKIGDALSQARAELRGLIESMQVNDPYIEHLNLDVQGILELIPSGGALVAPVVTQQGSAVIVVPGGSQVIGEEHVLWLDSFYEQDLKELLTNESGQGWFDRYSDWQSGGQLSDWMATVEFMTKQLWECLMGPIHNKLMELAVPAGSQVVVMPQGGLAVLPLHAAFYADADGERFFLDDFIVSYVPSAYSLYTSKRRLEAVENTKPSMLAVANPTSDLSYATLEGRAVSQHFPPGARKLLEGASATVESVKYEAPVYTHLHFSCHAFHDWTDVMRSGLHLAEEGTLTLLDIVTGFELDSSRLVVLSACETGMFDFDVPDEYIGLPAGFLRAGTPGVVSTLWAVGDQPAYLLMEHFYQLCLGEFLSPAKALREAQIRVRNMSRRALIEFYREPTHLEVERMPSAYTEALFGGDADDTPFSNPHYWAAFTLSGI